MRKVNSRMENRSAADLDLTEWEDGTGSVPVPRVSWRKAEWCILAAAVLAAGCYFFSHFPYAFTVRHHLPGIGLTLSHCVLTLAFLFAARAKKRLDIRRNCGGAFMLACSVLISVCYGRFANDSLRLMNLPVLLLTTVCAMFSLAGAAPFPALSARGLKLCIKQVIPSCFRHFLFPPRAAKCAAAEKNKQSVRHILAGLLIGMPIILLALFLLSSADAVFDSVVLRSLESVGRLDFGSVFRALLTVFVSLCLFSLVYSAVSRPFEADERKSPRAANATLITILLMLGTVYAVFAYIQFSYLFFGAQSKIQALGYAEYARSGFFQLVALAVLTLCLIIPFLSLCGGNRTVRALCAVITFLTGVIDYSAFFRMRLYIQAYGMSVLRLITLWGMLMILCALIACAIKCLKPEARICPVLTVTALCTWIALNFANVDRVVTAYQVRAFNNGAITRLDTSYFANLSPDVLPALAEISDGDVRRDAVDSVSKALSARYPVWYDWSLSWTGCGLTAGTDENGVAATGASAPDQ